MVKNERELYSQNDDELEISSSSFDGSSSDTESAEEFISKVPQVEQLIPDHKLV